MLMYKKCLLNTPTYTQQSYLVPQNGNWAGFSYETGCFKTTYIAFVYEWTDTDNEIAVSYDGTYTSTTALETDMFDYESLRAYIKSWADWSSETGTPIICNEFGIPIGLPENVRRAYLDSVFELLKEYNIPWTLYTNNYDIWGPLVYTDSTTNGVLPADGSYKTDGNYAIDEVLLDVISKYTED